MSFSDTIARTNATVLRTFGESVSYRPDGGRGDPVSLTVIWDDSGSLPKGIRATAWAPESSFATRPVKNDLIERNGTEYRVTDPPEGVMLPRDGAYTLYLRVFRNAPDA